MNKAKLFIGIFLAAYGVIVVGILTKWSDDTNMKFIATLGYIVAYITLIFRTTEKNSEDFDSIKKWFNSNGNAGYAAKKDELYDELKRAISSVSNHAYLTYFSKRAPTGEPDRPENVKEQLYQDSVRGCIKSGNKPIRRIIALFPGIDTECKKTWIKEELRLCNNTDVYQLQFIVVDSKEDLPFNVQIIDNFSYIIDPSRKNHDARPRDIHLKSKEIAEIWQEYYLELWDKEAKAIDQIADLENINEYTG